MRTAFGWFPLLLSWFLVVMGSIVLGLLLLSPAELVPGLVIRTTSDQQMQAMLAGRILAMVVMLIIALRSKDPRLLGLVFAGRIIAELSDVAGATLNGQWGAALSAGVGTLLEVGAVVQLWRARANGTQRDAMKLAGTGGAH